MKLVEMREKTIDELKGAIIDWKKELLSLRMQLSTHKLENTAQVSKTKRLIAQAKTLIKEKASEPAEVKPKAKKVSKKAEVKNA